MKAVSSGLGITLRRGSRHQVAGQGPPWRKGGPRKEGKGRHHHSHYPDSWLCTFLGHHLVSWLRTCRHVLTASGKFTWTSRPRSTPTLEATPVASIFQREPPRFCRETVKFPSVLFIAQEVGPAPDAPPLAHLHLPLNPGITAMHHPTHFNVGLFFMFTSKYCTHRVIRTLAQLPLLMKGEWRGAGGGKKCTHGCNNRWAGL